jgi:hypothetical protein
MKNIATALVKARSEFGPARKNAVNPHLKNRYANLEACLDAVTEPLIRNDIYMYQETACASRRLSPRISRATMSMYQACDVLSV